MQVRRAFVALTIAAAVAACSSESPTVPPALEAPGVEFTDAMLRQLTAAHALNGMESPTVRRAVAEAERLLGGAPVAASISGGAGPQSLPPPDPNMTPRDIAGILWNVTMVLYRNNYFADSTGDPRADRAIAILHPVDFAMAGLDANDADQAIAGFEATIEWYEQRTAEGLVPADVAQFIYDYANIGIDKLGGSNMTRTLCLTSAERACVTMTLSSIRWEVAQLRTRLTHDFSYAFLDAVPARIEARFKLVTGAPNCVLNTDFAVSGTYLLPAVVRREPSVISNPNNGGSTMFGCVPYGIIRGFQWDGLVVRDASGSITAICSKSAGNPCWEPAAATD